MDAIRGAVRRAAYPIRADPRRMPSAGITPLDHLAVRLDAKSKPLNLFEVLFVYLESAVQHACLGGVRAAVDDVVAFGDFLNTPATTSPVM